ncbi:hypothetical protein GCM10009737_36350 [Nocardioides lentus]|uniref:Uncharacterized protein n=1 Tax=Nocardioides lentus TaxID=338077 RepID=A0ABP5B5R9_9ACTN
MGAVGAAFCAAGTIRSVTGAAFGARLSALRRALSPPTKNTEASIGRAIIRMAVMGAIMPDRPQRPPGVAA